MDTREAAEAFSGHRFEAVYDRLTPDVVWSIPGQAAIEGREQVVAACREALAGFDQLASATFDRFVSGGDERVAAVDAVGRYEQRDGTVSVVSSADVYEFDVEGRITRITSYMVELPAEG